MVTINGEKLPYEGKTVARILEENSCNGKRVAVERNGLIVPRAAYETTILQDGDTVEVVRFVGGG